MREREYEGGTRVGGQLTTLARPAGGPGVFCRHPLQNAFRILVNLDLRRIKKKCGAGVPSKRELTGLLCRGQSRKA